MHGNKSYELPLGSKNPIGRVIIITPKSSDNSTLRSAVINGETWGAYRYWLPRIERSNHKILQPKGGVDNCGFRRETAIKTPMKVMNGACANGILIPKGDILGFPTSDKHAVVVYDPKRDLMIGLCVDLNSLTRRKWMLNNTEGRGRFTVLSSAVDLLLKLGSRRKDILVYVCCGIGPESYSFSLTDSTQGENNRKILEYLQVTYGNRVVPVIGEKEGNIDLFQLMVEQGKRRGISRDKFRHDRVDTGRKLSPLTGKPSELASSRRRTRFKTGEKTKTGKEIWKQSKNLIMVHHYNDPEDDEPEEDEPEQLLLDLR